MNLGRKWVLAQCQDCIEPVIILSNTVFNFENLAEFENLGLLILHRTHSTRYRWVEKLDLTFFELTIRMIALAQ